MIEIKVSIFSNSKKINNEDDFIDVKKKIEFLGFEVVENMNECDIVIAIGGDGTILRIARDAALLCKPVLGINFGRVGFMSSLEKNELDLLNQLLVGNFSIEQRSMLKIEVNNQYFFALNDAVVSRGPSSKMIDIEVSTKEKIISKYRSDGIIIATPTGSTAYSLSAGGAVVDPEIKCMLITPICPHMKFSCPIVIGGRFDLQVRSFSKSYDENCLLIDGEKVTALKTGNRVSISLAKETANFIKLKNTLFFEDLNRKINFISTSLF